MVYVATNLLSIERIVKDMDKFPYVEVNFVIEGRKLNLEQLTEKLKITPTITRGIDDWPQIVKDNKSLPEKLWPRYVWGICCEERPCKKLETPINKLISKLEGKEQTIIEICKKYGLKKCVVIVIHADSMSLPELVFPSYIVSYFGKLEVEVSFDMYVY